ncbi:hypothetical protein GCM10023342_24230 [Modicisalibacter zincidurans]|uniref:Uncharacterized protein n=1 Tax=Modicisalibacter zincidurans TaxID=1178777 RepID=A0ABP9RG12_9GAMM
MRWHDISGYGGQPETFFYYRDDPGQLIYAVVAAIPILPRPFGLHDQADVVLMLLKALIDNLADIAVYLDHDIRVGARKVSNSLGREDKLKIICDSQSGTAGNMLPF